MKTLDLYEVQQALKATRIRGHDTQKITHVTVKPEDIRENTMYIDLFPNRLDGNLFCLRESTIIVTSNYQKLRNRLRNNISILEVENIQEAYWQFVEYYRGLFQIPVIGVTGTCGKTTTTEMIKTILSRYYQIQATDDGKNSLSNNLPYLLGINSDTKAAVIEMGVSHPGCIENSCRHFRPQVGIILNIGIYHLLGCKTFENYVKAKAEMIDGIHPYGTLIVNADDRNIHRLDFSSFDGDVLAIGTTKHCDFRAQDIQFGNKGMEFSLFANGKNYPVFVPGYGEHNVYNALAALAACYIIGMDLQRAIKTLGEFKPVRQHLEFRQGPKGSVLIDDTWNCTPPSVTSALKVLNVAGAAKGRETIAVLGYMPQLGENGKQEYEKIASQVLNAGVDRLITIGEADRIGKKAVQLGMSKKKINYCYSGKEVLKAIKPYIEKRPVILLKFPFKFRLSRMDSFRKLMKKLS